MKHVSLMLAASLILAACGPTKPVQLGFLAGLSGRSADLGEAARNGVMLAIEQRNLAGGINGRAIELIVRDDREDPETAARGAAELAASGVAAIIGPITSSMAVAALPSIEKAKVVMVSPTVTAMQLVGKDDYLFRINATTRDYARMYADFHYRHTGLRRLAEDLVGRDALAVTTVFDLHVQAEPLAAVERLVEIHADDARHAHGDVVLHETRHDHEVEQTDAKHEGHQQSRRDQQHVPHTRSLRHSRRRHRATNPPSVPCL